MADSHLAPQAGGPRPSPLGVPASYPYPEVGVTRLLEDAAKDFPQTDAVEMAGHRLTYREVDDQVDRLATGLAQLGIRPGDRVGLLLPSCPQLLIAFLGALRAGATAVPLDPESKALAGDINATGCRALICLSAWYERLTDLKGRLPTVRHILATGWEDYLPFPRNLGLPVTGRRQGAYRRIPRAEGVVGFKDLIRRTAPEPLPAGRDAPAAVCGGLVFSHEALVAGAFQLRLWVPDVQAGRERLLSEAAPAGPLAIGVLLGLGVLAASTIAFLPPPGALTSRAVRRAAPTLLIASPRTFAGLADDSGALASVRVGLAGRPIDPGLAARIHESTGTRVRGGLEVAGVPGLAHANPVYGRAKPGSAGLALTDTETAVLAPDGRPLPAGEVGCVAVRGPQVASGHWGDAVAHIGVFAGSWLRTDQRGHLDGEGYLWPEERA